MIDKLLSPTARLEGRGLVTSWVRPVKAAYIVPTDSVEKAVHAIQSCCVSWGGSHHILVPYEDGLSDDWARILERYDPDFVTDLASMSAEDAAKLSDNDHFVHSAGSDGEPVSVQGAFIHTAAAVHLEALQPEQLYIVIPNVPEDHPLRLQFLAHYGSLVDESTIRHALRDHGILPTARLDQIFRVVSADFTEAGVDALLDPPLQMSLPAGIVRTWLLPDLTLMNVAIAGPSRPLLDPKSSEYESENRKHASMIVVTGPADSVADLCLFWTIRANRGFLRRPFPIWLPLEHLRQPSGRALIKTALGRAGNPPVPRLFRDDALYVLSSSSDEQEIASAIRGEIPCKIVTEAFSDFIPDNFERGEREELDISFENGGAHLPHPAGTDKLRRLGDLDRVTREIRIANFQLPQIPSLRNTVFGDPWRITRTGFAHSFYPRHRDRLDSLYLPATWKALEGVCNEAGYRVQVSDKGQLAEGVLGILGDLNRVALLCSSLVYQQLAAMAETAGRQHFRSQLHKIAPGLRPSDVDEIAAAASAAAAEEVRSAQVFSRFVDKLGGDAALTQQILNWLLDRRIIFRGADLVCPECGYRRWYSIDSFGSEYRCEGCQRLSRSPLEATSTNWHYRLNQLYARAYDQGVLVHLLVAYQRAYGSFVSEDSLGYHPGVQLVSETGPAELDYVSIQGGRLSIGECKVSIERFDDAEADKLIGLAKALNCTEVVIGTLSPEVPESLVARLENAVEHVEIWTHSDLIDSSPLSEKPEESGLYLRRVVEQMKYWSQ